MDKLHPSVVLVMAENDPALERIRAKLEQLGAELILVGSLRQFRELVRRSSTLTVIITGVSLPDGNWCDVLTSAVRAGSPARVLVCSPTADERFWSEAIWRGVHDVIVEPFTTDYLRRSVDPDRSSDPHQFDDENQATQTSDRGLCISSGGISSVAALMLA